MDEKKRREVSDETEIDLLELFFFLLRKWKFLVLGLVIGAIIGGGIAVTSTPTYVSQSMLFVLSETTSITSLSDIQIGSELSSDFVVIATSKPVLDTAIEVVEEETGVTLTRDDILDMLTVENEDDTRILIISAEYEDPEVACAVANAVTEATAEQIAALMKSDPPTTVEEAEVAEEAESNGFTKKAAIGGIIGIVIMLIIFIIPYLADDKVKTAEDVEKYVDSTVLAVIPIDRSMEYSDESSKSKSKKKKAKNKKE